MILADTSVWVDHLRRGNARLVETLEASVVLCHPFVIGELACGTLRNRASVLALLGELPQATVAGHDEVLTLLQARRLMGRGLGYVDVCLLAAALLDGATLWTRDKRLAQAAKTIGVDT